MSAPIDPTVTARCQCGAEYPLSLAGKDLQTLEFVCPKCGGVDRLTPEQILGLKARLGDAVAELSGPLAEELEPRTD